jgi:2-amino-4-hydroxy-6-hydroxymethyldihydropteridine diphosphokinase
MKYFLSLGSNLGQKRRNLKRALSLLENESFKVLRQSSLYRTQPVGRARQPWFINQVVEGKSSLCPLDFLAAIKNIEKKMKRRKAVRYGPRRIDILLAENSIISTSKLVVPHPRLARRNFVLFPLREISPRTIHPVMKKSIAYLAEKSEDDCLVEKIPSS